MFDDQAETAVVALRRMIDRMEAEWLRRVADLEARERYEAQGYTSMVSWLADRCGVGWGRARQWVGTARALERMPETVTAYRTGEIDGSRVRQLVRARSRSEALFGRDESVLVDAARTLSAREFTTAVSYWCDAADAEAAMADADAVYARRRLHVSVTFSGMCRVDGDLDPEGGQVVRTALEAHVDSWSRSRDDARTVAQKRADALVEICRDFLDHGDPPTTGGEKPHVSLIVDLERLTDGSGRSEFDDGTVITRRDALRVVCDASVSRIVTNGPSEVLDVGRRTRTVTTAQRRALTIRDRGCTAPGCDRPSRWCDVHHIEPWALGGPTDLDNLTLLCRRHHRLIHQTAHDP